MAIDSDSVVFDFIFNGFFFVENGTNFEPSRRLGPADTNSHACKSMIYVFFLRNSPKQDSRI